MATSNRVDGKRSDSRPSDSSDSFQMEAMHSSEDLHSDEETGLTGADRKRRRHKKWKNTNLDQRIANDDEHRKSEERLATASLLRNILINGLMIALWYSFSISISVYNKWMFSKDNLDFHFPLFTTSVHMLVQFSLASAVLYFMPRFRPSAAPAIEPEEPAYAQLEDEDDEDGTIKQQTAVPPSKQPLMTKWFYISRISPCGAATALDIGLGNFSLRFISLTFYTMCKSSVLAFVLLFAFIFHLESPTWKLCLIILFMTAGVVMMVAGETAFSALGFVLVMSASACSGFRWSLTQILLLRNRATGNPFSSIFFLTPIMFLALIILALPIEGPANIVAGIRELAHQKGGFVSLLLILFPGTLAFAMVSAEFALLKRSSVVTLSVCGIFKEVLTISAAGAIFGDELSPINISGLVVTIASIAAYNYLKYHNMRRQAQQEAHHILEDGMERDTREIQDHQRRDGTSALPTDEFDLSADADGGKQTRKVKSVSRSPSKRPGDVE